MCEKANNDSKSCVGEIVAAGPGLVECEVRGDLSSPAPLLAGPGLEISVKVDC